MAPHRHALLFLSLLCTLLPVFSAVHDDHKFENTAIVRTVELGGSLVHVRTTYAVRATQNGAKTYTIALGEREASRAHFMEAKVKGQKDLLEVESVGLEPQQFVPCLRVDRLMH